MGILGTMVLISSKSISSALLICSFCVFFFTKLLCESFDDVRGLIEELKEAFSEDEKLESIFKKKQASDKSNLKYQWTNLIQDNVASPELEISKNDEDSVVSPLSQPNDFLKPSITPPTPTCDQKPTIHSVDMLLAISKIGHSVKTESQENSGLSEEVVSSDRRKTDDQNHNVHEFEVEQKCLDTKYVCLPINKHFLLYSYPNLRLMFVRTHFACPK